MYRKQDFMILLNILDIKDTMSHLLIKDSFDNFFIEEADVLTYARLTISGRRNKEWYDSDEKELPDLLRWNEVKKIIFEYIKGKKTPSIMKVSLKADEDTAYKMLNDSGCYNKLIQYKPDLYINIKYENDRLSIITGISYSDFVMDKTVERAWDEAVGKLIKKLEISYEI